MKVGTTKYAIAYVRAMANNEVASQLAAIERFAHESGLEIKKVFLDSGDADRSGLEEALNYAMSGSKQTLIIWSLDRIDSRFKDLKSFISFLNELTVTGASFISVIDHINTSGSAVDFILNVGSAIKKFKSRLQGERVHRSLLAAKAGGRSIGRPKRRNDVEIRKLRSEGHSIRQIAAKVGLSTWAIHSALKENSN